MGSNLFNISVYSEPL